MRYLILELYEEKGTLVSDPLLGLMLVNVFDKHQQLTLGVARPPAVDHGSQMIRSRLRPLPAPPRLLFTRTGRREGFPFASAAGRQSRKPRQMAVAGAALDSARILSVQVWADALLCPGEQLFSFHAMFSAMIAVFRIQLYIIIARFSH